MFEIKIRNKKIYKEKGVYIGRPYILSNPFHITKTQSRELCIHRYCVWLKDAIFFEDPRILSELKRLYYILLEDKELNLICYCSPLKCHGDIIKQILLNKFYTGSWLIKKDDEDYIGIEINGEYL